ncbi:hypothetical protein SAMN05661093_03651 [Kibdelosporangium aridum]|uniref:Uncharacterized protein n=1 Tax=Kibdelosporangium aridum TaxID=2030 RepID=A0A1W2DP91_KIBAR|nr:hypothetical protein SAMN05661093_03651 [Kibdelosporangium aridum]
MRGNRLLAGFVLGLGGSLIESRSDVAVRPWSQTTLHASTPSCRRGSTGTPTRSSISIEAISHSYGRARGGGPRSASAVAPSSEARAITRSWQGSASALGSCGFHPFLPVSRSTQIGWMFAGRPEERKGTNATAHPHSPDCGYAAQRRIPSLSRGTGRTAGDLQHYKDRHDSAIDLHEPRGPAGRAATGRALLRSAGLLRPVDSGATTGHRRASRPLCSRQDSHNLAPRKNLR